MFTNMLSHHHHHRPGSPAIGISASSIANTQSAGSPAPEQKYAPLHNAADAMRRHCMPSPVTYSGNLFAGFDESFLARAEALVSVDYPGKSQFKPEPAVSSYYPMGGPPPHHHIPHQTHHHGMAMTPGAVPPPVYGTMPPPPHPGIHHPSPLHSVPQCVTQAPISITESGADLMEQLSNPSHCSSFSSYAPPSFSNPSGLIPISEPSSESYNPPPPLSFHTGSAMTASSSASPLESSSHHHNAVGCSTSISHPTVQDPEMDPRELEAFAERFKQRRIKLGVTQCDVGQALAKLKMSGVSSLSQSTICRFESLTLSHNNMVALKPILTTWLDLAEAEYQRKMKESGLTEKKRKRTSIAAPEKRSLEAYFHLQPRPTSEKIAMIADKLDLKKNVVRVWFCNQRQKQKRMKFSANNGETSMM